MNSDQPQDRAEALFKKKQERLREGQQAMAEYQADRRAVGEKTARLRALRLARDAAQSQPDTAPDACAAEKDKDSAESGCDSAENGGPLKKDKEARPVDCGVSLRPR